MGSVGIGCGVARRRTNGCHTGACCAVLLGIAAALGCSPAQPGRPLPAGAPTTQLLSSPPPRIQAEVIEGEFRLFDVPVGTMVLRVCPGEAPGESTVESRIRAAALIRAVRSVGGTGRTVLSPELDAPVTSEFDVIDGDVTRSYRIQFAPGRFDYEFQKTGEELRRGRHELPEPATPHDLHTALLLLRAWNPRLDEEAHFYVVLGRRPWRVRARSAGRAVLLIGGSPRVTTRIDGEAHRVDKDTLDPDKDYRTFSLWFEEGANAVPVRLSATSGYGDVTMTLVRYESSAGPCRRALASE